MTPTYTIGKEWTFDAAHQLPLHDGKCRRPHGHTYRVQLTITGTVATRGPKTGMVYDFGDLTEIWKKYIEPDLDHQDLNKTLPIPATTAELIAGWILTQFRSQMGPMPGLTVKVYETPGAWAQAS